MNSMYFVTVLVIFEYLFFAIQVGKARETYGIKAPAISGNEMFERFYRVQMNTLELLICFIPAMFMAAHYWSPRIMAFIGAVFFVGRFIYFKQYTSAPEKRSLGFGLSIMPIFVFLLAIIAGLIKTKIFQ